MHMIFEVILLKINKGGITYGVIQRKRCGERRAKTTRNTEEKAFRFNEKM